MEQQLLGWARVAARELMSRGHLSLQTLLTVTLFQADACTGATLKNYLPCLKKPDKALSICRLYARAGLVEELRQAQQELTLSDYGVIEVIRAGARGGHWPILEPFFQEPVHDKFQRTFLCLTAAVKRGHLEIVQRVMAYSSLGISTMAQLAQTAARSGRVDIFKALLSTSIIDRPGSQHVLMAAGSTQDVLMAAVESRNPEMVTAALQGMQVPFMILDAVARAACQMPGSTAALMVPFVEVRPQLLNLLLVTACEKGNLEVAQRMLDRGASDFDSALAACYEHRKIELVQFLLDRGARDPSGYLVAYGGPKIAGLLLKAGACQPQQALTQDALYFMPDILRLVLAAGPVDLEMALRKALALLPCQPQALGSVMALVEAGAGLPQGDPLYSQTLEACLRLAKSNSSDLSSRAAAVEYMAGVSAEDALAGLAEMLAKDVLARRPQVPAETQADVEDYYCDY